MTQATGSSFFTQAMALATANTASTALPELIAFMGNRLGQTRANQLLAKVGHLLTLEQQYTLQETYLYGSSRLGVKNQNTTLSTRIASVQNGSLTPIGNAILNTDSVFTGTAAVYGLPKAPSARIFNRTWGLKQYELSNHLGNVQVTISDKKLGVVGANQVDFVAYEPEVKSATDYYAYGMEMPGKEYKSENYRFGFGGHETMNQANGRNNVVDMGDRWLDVRLGRTNKVDSKEKKFPDVSPYSYAANNPIFFKDPDGKEVQAYSHTAQQLVLRTLNYAFGSEHGFTFENNKLIHKGDMPKNLSPQQSLLFKHFNETLINSVTITEVKANTNISTRVGPSGELQVGGLVVDGKGETFGYKSERIYEQSNSNSPQPLVASVPAFNDIIITSGLLSKGINLSTKDGIKNFGAEHATLHEFAHAIVNTILTDFEGVFDGVDFKKMNKNQRRDWAIRFTNTLLESRGEPLEDGAGQHGRSSQERLSDEEAKPLNR